MGVSCRAVRIGFALIVIGALVSTPATAAARTSVPRASSATTIPAATVMTVFTSGARVGDPICIEASLSADGYPLRNRTIVFAIQGVPVGSATTGIPGRASLCVTAPVHGGTYPEGIGAGFAGDALFAPSTGSAELTIWPRETYVHLFDSSGTYLESATFATQLTFPLFVGTIPDCIPSKPPNPRSCAITIDVPLAGRTVFFFLLGALVGSAVTDANGGAVLPGVPLGGLNVGPYPTGITAVFAGEPDYAGGTASNLLVVRPQATSLLVAPVAGPAGGSTSVSALLRFNGGLPLLDRPVVFYVNDLIVGTATSGPSGVATLADVSLANVAPGTYPDGVKALFMGELNFQWTANRATLTVGSASPSAAAK